MNDSVFEIQPVPPPGLEDRVAAALRERRLIRTSIKPTANWEWRNLAAGLAMFVAGGISVLLWSGIGTGTLSSSPKYLLILEGEGIPAPNGDRRKEYGDWMRKVDRKPGVQMIVGEELKGQGWSYGPVLAGRNPTGFFLFHAASLRDAQAIASATPHLRHGGTARLVEVVPAK